MNLEQAQSAMRIRQTNQSRPGRKNPLVHDPIAEGRARCAMFCLFVGGLTVEQIARRYGRSPRWVQNWVDANMPLV
jgi:hypothetical protein